ncbi:diaminobutyrate--2-oxoglutarate transaminase family protein [Dactylosporangium sp. NPDC000555]|uniref:diaminobutyrate--2-oxoglutarate transaminase family protein n=1 Tax=Dactylosporangium sp. NPDC000555 TaxID=3154260 RepID=UPI0033196933
MTVPAVTEQVQLEIRTPIPGPGSTHLLREQERLESNARTYPRRLPIAVDRAFGPYLRDVDGNVFIDFLNGAGALPLGHTHPEVVEAVEAQLRRHVHGLDLPSPVRQEFVDAHLSLLAEPMRSQTKIHFCGPTGANAIEAAIKLCKVHTGRSGIVAFQGGFHGSTHGAMSVSGLVGPKNQVGAAMPDTHFLPYSYCRRCPLGLSPSSCDTNCATYLSNTLRNDFGGVPRPAAILLELVQGEGGVIPATAEFVQRVAATAAERDIPLIVDEIQTGYGRTGTWFAFQRYGIEPDVVVVSKAVGGIGLPVAAILYNRRLDSWAPGTHIGTFRGHHLAFAASVATLRVMHRDNVLDNVTEQGDWMFRQLRGLAARHAAIADVRGTGLMVGVEIADPATGQPSGTLAAAVQAAALSRGLIVEVGGQHGCVIRMLPPLNVSRAVVDTAIAILDESLAELGS